MDDGFIERNTDLLAIEEEWKENFTEDDISFLLNASEMEMLLRRYGSRPVGVGFGALLFASPVPVFLFVFRLSASVRLCGPTRCQ